MTERKVFWLFLLFVCLAPFASPVFAEEEREEYSAVEILEMIRAGRDVVIRNAVIRGELDFTTLPSESLPDGTKVVHIPGSISIVESEITDDVTAFSDEPAVKVAFDGPVEFEATKFFGLASFYGAEFSGDASFDGATFSGVAAFEGAKFSGDAVFSDAEFSGGAGFSRAEFSEGASFYWAEFSEAAWFYDAEFSGGAYFYGAEFSEEGVSFYWAEFSRGADFREAEFSGGAYFYGAEFSEEGVSFVRAEFSGDAVFSDAEFSGGAGFSDAEFSGDAVFSDAEFSGGAVFSRSEFSEEAIFSQTVFDSDADFEGARFEKAVSFRAAQFEGQTDFAGAEFKGIVFFLEAQFKAPLRPLEEGREFGESVRFDQVTFHDLAVFRKAQFEHATFSGRRAAIFLNAVDFRKSQFQTADFSEVVFQDADFTGATVTTTLAITDTIYKNLRIDWQEVARVIEPRDDPEVFRRLEENFRDLKRLDYANGAYYQRKIAERQSRSPQEQYLEMVLVDWICGYGVRPGNVVIVSIALILLFTFRYLPASTTISSPPTEERRQLTVRLRELPLASSRQEQKWQEIHKEHSHIGRFWRALGFSFTVFTKIGFGDIYGTRRVRRSVILEWFLGLIMISLLFYTLSNTVPVLHTLLTGVF